MDLDRLANGARWRLQMLPRRLSLLRQHPQLEEENLELSSTVGYKLAARLTFPRGQKSLPGLVISPAIHQGIAELNGPSSPISPAEIAALGYAVLAFDPAGRGQSWGTEDFGGPEHQDDLRVAIRHLAGDPRVKGSIGVLSLSMGVAAAVGCLSQYRDLPVRWLLDWEGPSDREILTAGGTIMVPADGHHLEEDAYWNPREAVRRVGSLPCGYVRLQALPDHAQPREIRHAERMIRAAKSGNLPWFQLNDHARNELPARPNWLPGGPWQANRALLRKLRALNSQT